jgi:cholesterol oxidase
MINGAAARAGPVEHVDCVVVGSGFGGSVAAYRFAQAGRSVVVLERGRAYPPGSFARSPAAMSGNFWDPSQGLYGLFDVWSFHGLEGVVSSGLGGGSLIYANVLLRKDEHWFVHESPVPGGGYENWPVTREDLDQHYDRVEQMLGATPYPYPDTPKTAVMREGAARLGLDYQLPPLAVTFASRAGAPAVPGAPITNPEYGNVHGLPRQTCRLCGECDVGCNYGAKNTLDHTYLSAAQHHSADLRTRCEVRGFAPLAGGGYEVRYVVHERDREGVKTVTDKLPLRTITCDRLVLAAGTFGTTYLLLRSRAALPGLSKALGTRFCGNGDLLGLMLHRHPAGTSQRPMEASRGPVITSAIRVGDELDGPGSTGRGFYIEDAGYPGFVDWLVETSQVVGSVRRAVRFGIGQVLSHLRGGPRSNISRQLAALLGPGSLSGNSLPLLGMGRDVPDGVMRLKGGYLAIDWTTKTSERYFERVLATMRALADDAGASFHDNPLWWARRVITVHPLGGAPIGRHAGEAVCDSYGEVFEFPGLHVLDGAAMPGPVGANPSLTIAALADRACDKILSGSLSHRTRAPFEPTSRATLAAERTAGIRVPAPRTTEGSGQATSLAFTEEMKGYVALGVTDSRVGRARGRSLGQKLMFRLTITVDDVVAFVADRDHLGRAEGYVDCDVLGGRLPVRQGWFNLFTRDGDPATRRMLYRLHLTDPAGDDLTFVGHKEVHDDPGLDVWPDTSTLYARILMGHTQPETDDQARVVAAGILNILVPDFAVQLTTFRAEGPRKAHAFASFGRLFLGELWAVYGPQFSEEAQHETV